MEKLESLFKQTYSSTSNFEIESATEQIESMYSDPSFYQNSCLILSQNMKVNETLSKAVLNGLTKGLEKQWNFFHPDFRASIINEIIKITYITDEKLIRQFEKLFDIIIKLDKFECLNVQNVLSVIYQLFHDNHYLIALIIMKSVTKLIKNPTTEMYHVYDLFSDEFGKIISMFISEQFGTNLLSYVFHIVSRLSINRVHPSIQSIYLNLIQLFITFGIPDGNIHMFANEGFKMIIRILNYEKTIIPDEMICNILNIIPNYLEVNCDNSKDKNFKGKLFSLLNTIIIKNKRFELIDKFFIPLIPNVIFPIFYLTNDEIQMIKEDPACFVQESHQIELNWDDTKASCMKFLKNCSKYDNLFNSSINFVTNVMNNSLSTSDYIPLFSAFRFLSSIMPSRQPEETLTFLSSITQLFDHQNDIVRCAAFLLLSQCNNIPFNEQILMHCFNHLNDNFKLISYYASVTFANVINDLSQESQKQMNIVLSPYAETIFKHFSSIASEFRDPQLYESLSSLASIFQDSIIQIAPQIFDQTYNFFITSCKDENGDLNNDNIFIASDALIKIVDVLGTFPNLNVHFYKTVCNGLLELINSDHFGDLLNILNKIIEKIEVFDVNYWQIVSLLMKIIESNENIILNEIDPIIEEIIFKDKELGKREDIVNSISSLIISKCDEELHGNEEIEIPFSIASCLVLQCKEKLPIIDKLFEYLTIAAKRYIDPDSICVLYSSMLISYKQKALQCDPDIIQIWMDNHSYPLYLASFLTFFPLVNSPDVKANSYISALKSIIFKIQDEEIEDFGDDDDDCIDIDYEMVANIEKRGNDASIIRGPEWFEPEKLLQSFMNLSIQIKDNDSDLFNLIVEAGFNENINVNEMIPKLPEISKEINKI